MRLMHENFDRRGFLIVRVVGAPTLGAFGHFPFFFFFLKNFSDELLNPRAFCILEGHILGGFFPFFFFSLKKYY